MLHHRLRVHPSDRLGGSTAAGKPKKAAAAGGSKKKKAPLEDSTNRLDDSFGDDMDEGVATAFAAGRKSDPALANRAKKYQKISQLEHVLLRPDSYVGSTNFTENSPMWVMDASTGKMALKDIR